MKFCPQCRAELISQFFDGRNRLICQDACGFVHWNNPTPVVCAIIEHEGQVLLGRNANWPEGWFALITGFLERGETPEEGLLREVEEEVGMQGQIESFVGMYSFFEQNQLLLVYHVKTSGEVKLGAEIVEYKLEDKADVKPWPMGTGPALKDWLVTQGVSFD